MAEVASAYVSLIPSFLGGGRKIKKDLEDLGDEAGDSAGRKSGEKFSGSFAGAVKGLVGPVAAIFAGAKITEYLGGAIDQASDLNEAGTKLGVVFGDAVGTVNKFAAGGAKALGQSNLDVLNAAASFGVYGKAAGLSDAANADFSNSLVSLSTDLASFYNTDPGQAMEALGAGLRGEAEPLRSYGVLLDDATLRQKALELGLISTTKNALTPQQRVLAAQASIMEQTSLAQGDFARTSGGLANQQRILAAQASDLKTSLGSALLPAMLGLTVAANAAIGPIAELAGRGLSQLNLGISAAAAAFKEGDVTSDGFVGGMERAGNAVRGLYEIAKSGDFTTFLRAGLGVEEDSPVVTGLLSLREKVLTLFAGIRDGASPAAAAFAAIGPVLTSLVPQVLSLVASFSPLGIVLQSLLPVIPSLVSSLSQVFAVLAGSLASVLPSVLTLATALGSALSGALAAIAPSLAAVATALGPALAATLGAVAPVLAVVLTALAKFATILAPIAPAVLALVAGVALYSSVMGGLVGITAAVTTAKQAYAFATYGQTTAETGLLARSAAGIGALQARAVALYSNVAATTASIASTTASAASWVAATTALVASRVAIIATTVATKAFAAGQFLLNAALTANPIGLVVVAIAALVAAIVLAYRNSETFRNIVSAAWAGVQAAIGAVVTFVTGTVVPLLVGAWTSIASTATSVFDGIRDFFAKWWPLLLVIFFPAVAAVIALWNHFGDDIVGFTLKAWGLVRDYIVEPVKDAFAAVTAGIAAAIAYVQGKWNEAVAITRIAWALFQQLIVEPVKEAIAFVLQVVAAMAADLRSRFDAVVATVKAVWGAFRAALVDPVAGAVTEVNDKIGALVQAIVGKVTDTYNAAKDKAAAFVEVGADIINGIIKGLANGLQKVKDKAREIAEGALGAAKAALGIQSPSRAFMEVGAFSGEGLAIGLASSASTVVSATQDLASSMQQAATDALDGQSLGTSFREGLLDGVGSAVRASDALLSDAFAAVVIPGPRVPSAVSAPASLGSSSSGVVGTAGGPLNLNFFDADRVLLGTIQGVSDGSVSDAAADRLVALRQNAGRSVSSGLV